MKVMVGMSGGVDSSVACALLLEQGLDVVGATLCLADDAAGAIEDSRRVAERLGIEHRVFDFRADFERDVVFRFAAVYAAGATPNPCVDCNRLMKFPALLSAARTCGCDLIATGHYARLEGGGLDGWESHRDKPAETPAGSDSAAARPDAAVAGSDAAAAGSDSAAARPRTESVRPGAGTGVPIPGGRVRLVRGVDRVKDQSYVLYGLSQDILRHLVLPLGDLDKGQVRDRAEQLGLVVADKPESQDICFVPDGDYAGFLARRGERTEEGDIVDAAGTVLGRHRGLIHYTIGQRKGIGIAPSTADSCPWYVVGKDVGRNLLIVGRRDELGCRGFMVCDLNWVSIDPPGGVLRAVVQTRYHQDPVPASIVPGEACTTGRCARVLLDAPLDAVAPGQACVFYDGDVVLGGGTIR